MANGRLVVGAAARSLSGVLGQAAQSARTERSRQSVASAKTQAALLEGQAESTQQEDDIGTIVDGILGISGATESLVNLSGEPASALSKDPQKQRKELVNLGVALERRGAKTETINNIIRKTAQVGRLQGNELFDRFLNEANGDSFQALEMFNAYKQEQNALKQNMKTVDAFKEEVARAGSLGNVAGSKKLQYLSAFKGLATPADAFKSLKQLEPQTKSAKLLSAYQVAFFRDSQAIDYKALSATDRAEITRDVAIELVGDGTTIKQAQDLAKDIVKTIDSDPSLTSENYLAVYNDVSKDAKSFVEGKYFEAFQNFWLQGKTPTAKDFKLDTNRPKVTETIKTSDGSGETFTQTTSNVELTPDPNSIRLKITKGEYEAVSRKWLKWYQQADGTRSNDINQEEFHSTVDSELKRQLEAINRRSKILSGNSPSRLNAGKTRDDVLNKLESGGAITNSILQPLLENAGEQ